MSHRLLRPAAPPGILGLAALAAGLAVPPLVGFDPYYLYLLGTGFLFASLATAWNLLAVAGQTSFGHAAFFGAGAYASALLAQRAEWSPWTAVLAAAAVGGAVAVPIGLATARLAGPYLALGTLAYAEACRVVALNWTRLTGGGGGLIGIPDLAAPAAGLPAALGRPRVVTYYVTLTLLALSVAVFATLCRTRVGLAWAAIREREERAQLLGIAPLPYKVLAFGCSGALTGVAGALHAHTVRALEPDLVFGPGISILPLVMATFGGIRTVLGPTVGALSLHLVSALVLQPTLPRLHQLPYALALIVVVLFLPRGLMGRRDQA